MGGGGAHDGCGRCMKISLVGVNVVAFVGGALTLALALWVALERSFPSTLLASNLYAGGVGVLVVTGAATLLLSLAGCYAAAKEIKCILLAYYITVLMTVSAMLVGGVLLLVFRGEAAGSLRRQLTAALPYYGERREYTAAWDDTQALLQCCGVVDHGDWLDRIPSSCCREVYAGKRLECRQNPNPSTLYAAGCADKVLDLLQHNAAVAGVVAIVVSLLMILGLVFSCGLFMKIE